VIRAIVIIPIHFGGTSSSIKVNFGTPNSLFHQTHRIFHEQRDGKIIQVGSAMMGR
jgi:short-subunit dehydrogenase